MTRDERVVAILAVARQRFSEQGYEQTAVAEIAAQLGVVEGTVYKYFASKRELLLKVLAAWYEQMFGDYARELAAIDGARARLQLLIWRHLRSIRDEPLLCRLMFREINGAGDYRGSPLHAMNRRYTQFLVDVIEAGQASGEFRRDVSAPLLRDLVYGAIEHHSWHYIRRAGIRGARRVTLDIDSVATQITQIVCDGIAGHEERLDVRRLSELAARLDAHLQQASRRRNSA
nr:TetR/AcrR family transcriptional regulator [Solimonas marina]